MPAGVVCPYELETGLMEQTTDETHGLRRCVRELAALSVLSAAWGRTGPQGIADGLAEVLMRSLPPADFVYARVNDLADAACHEAVRTTEPKCSVGLYWRL